MFRLSPIAHAAVVCASLVSVGAAQAQEKLERVEVTGTRIKSVGAVSNSPILSISQAEVSSSQPVAVEEVIKGLPAAVPAIGPGTNNGSGGGATLNLRGLGSQRSLVLIDGRRMVPFNLDGEVDTNAIPLALLRRVDLVTGGASAVYGADAVAGVANFVLNRSFTGVQLDTSYGTSQERDAGRKRADLTVGHNFWDGRASLVASLGVTKTDALRQGDRDIGKESLSSTNGQPQGSGTGSPSSFQINSVANIPAGTPSLANVQIDPVTGRLVAPFNSYNFNPLNYYVTPMDRKQGTLLGSVTLSDHVQLYADLFFTKSTVVSNLAPTGTFLNVFQVPIGNPYIPDAARQQICQVRGISAANCVLGNTTEVPMAIGRRFTEFGPRVNDFDNKATQATVGVKGDLTAGWSYDSYLSSGKATQLQTRGDWGSRSKVQQALRALSKTECLDKANGCVPINLWGADGSITPEMAKFVNLDSAVNTSVKQLVAAASVSGDLGGFKSPFAQDSIGVALGLEHRKVTASNASDAAAQIQGEVLGTGAPTPDRSGTLKLDEVFGELSIPLLQKKPYAQKLGLELGYRHTQFTTSSKQNYGSYKYGAEWAPVDSLRLRAMQQRATRAPNVNELYAPLVSGLSNLAIDPCQETLVNQAQANTAGTLSNLCRLTGVPATALGNLPKPSAGQINRRTGGNAELGPEVADTTTLGLVFQPRFMEGLTLTLDYYRINLSKAVSSPSVTDILDDCYSPTRNPTLALNAACALVLRGPLGTFNGADAPGVVTPKSNLGKQWVSGVDLGVYYQLKLGAMGALDLSLLANQQNVYKSQSTPSSVVRDCLGYYSVACEGPNYKSKWTQRATWRRGDWSLGYNWRHVDDVVEEPGGTNFLPAFSRIKAYDYVDLNASWRATKNLRLNLSINNAFNTQAPNVGNTIGTTGGNSGNTFPQSYDVVGRYYSLGLTLSY
ncbi:TonB-dependent receptor domain-containing protein [Roseateles sp. BYS180W]|uniref:TonB-dependent receptor domain-containing protein n=1 Tax=Roseateles rivi TaxID=3299028 RepID=A0ABW7FTS2_9BURK